MATFYVIPKDEDLQHYGILGMKWGVRRYQNEDGSLTSAGRKHYDIGDGKQAAKASIVGTLALGPLGGLAAGLYGRFASKEKVDKLVNVGTAVIAAELQAVGGFLVADLVGKHIDKVNSGKKEVNKFIDIDKYLRGDIPLNTSDKKLAKEYVDVGTGLNAMSMNRNKMINNINRQNEGIRKGIRSEGGLHMTNRTLSKEEFGNKYYGDPLSSESINRFKYRGLDNKNNRSGLDMFNNNPGKVNKRFINEIKNKKVYSMDELERKSVSEALGVNNKKKKEADKFFDDYKSLIKDSLGVDISEPLFEGAKNLSEEDKKRFLDVLKWG